MSNDNDQHGDQKTINFTPEKLRAFKKACEQAQQARADKQAGNEFTWDGNQYDVDYARYLIEYLEGRF